MSTSRSRATAYTPLLHYSGMELCQGAVVVVVVVVWGTTGGNAPRRYIFVSLTFVMGSSS